MTGPEDSHSGTRPISVAELLAKNGTIGAPPVGGRRRRRRGNSDAVTVAELTGKIPIVTDGALAETGQAPEVDEYVEVTGSLSSNGAPDPAEADTDLEASADVAEVDTDVAEADTDIEASADVAEADTDVAEAETDYVDVETEHADVDTVLVHGVEIFIVIEGVKTHAPHIVLRFGDEIQEFTGEGVKVSVDDHRCTSSLCDRHCHL